MSNCLGQNLDMPQTLRRNDAEFGHVSAQGVDQHRALPNQKAARPMQHQHRLLLGVLYRHKPHRRPRYRFTDRFRIGGIVFVALDVGLHIGRRHQLHPMSECDQLTSPIMRCRAGFHADQTRLERPEIGDHAAPPQPPANDNASIGVDAMDLEPVFGEV